MQLLSLKVNVWYDRLYFSPQPELSQTNFEVVFRRNAHVDHLN